MGKTNYLFSNSLWEEKEGIKKMGRRTRCMIGNWWMEKVRIRGREKRCLMVKAVEEKENRQRTFKLEQWTEEKEFLKW
jgi:hypothetical protein